LQAPGLTQLSYGCMSISRGRNSTDSKLGRLGGVVLYLPQIQGFVNLHRAQAFAHGAEGKIRQHPLEAGQAAVQVGVVAKAGEPA